MSQPQSSGRPSGRVIELDALRGLAALAVVGFHFTTRYDALFGHTGELPATLPWGHYGVDLFFMLSGLVILMSLERCCGPVHFAWGRLNRLYPTYWCAAAVTCVVVWSCGLPGQEVSVGEALLNATMLQALLGASHIDGAYWSLQAELIFYVDMLALWMVGVLRRPGRAVTLWVGAAALVQAAIVLSETHSPGLTPLLTKLRTVASLEFIPLFGVGLLLHSHATGRADRWDTAGWIACFGSVGLLSGPGSLAIDAGLAGLLGVAAAGNAPWLRRPVLVWLGAISYPLYLIHQNIGYVLIGRLEAAGASPLAAIAAATLLAVLLASWLHRGAEVPSLAYLRRVDPLKGWNQERVGQSPA